MREEGEEFLFEVRLTKTSFRQNPYMEKESDEGLLGTYPTVVGIVDEDMSDYGFARTIDMDYKDKPDQWTSNFLEVSAFLEQAEFEQLCKEHNIPLVVVPRKQPDRFADFFLRSSKEERLRVFTQAAHQANKDQREVFDQAKLAA